MGWFDKLLGNKTQFVCPGCKAKVSRPPIDTTSDEGRIIDLLLSSYGMHVIHMIQTRQPMEEIIKSLVDAGIDNNRSKLFVDTIFEDLANKGILKTLPDRPLLK
jgi:hypothetical protein